MGRARLLTVAVTVEAPPRAHVLALSHVTQSQLTADSAPVGSRRALRTFRLEGRGGAGLAHMVQRVGGDWIQVTIRCRGITTALCGQSDGAVDGFGISTVSF